ncbi:uncharacterized protein FA14DRAFT_176909 [Meira miltonrushii]|uniref:Uncharacterized protein n=1 Tax=Meira miltonrushii TaxID=1280837 RepID=A0A316VJE2_9BASI|nr:uncharacterized protein FA14DRAFT_176909 [Meira miltonrushii]PWN37620.1 hypothetical protein FA14DRAFT_176909 [Meira miltonrushii]
MVKLALSITIFVNLYFAYSSPTNSTQSSSSLPLHIETAAGNQAAQMLLEGEDYQFKGRHDPSAQRASTTLAKHRTTHTPEPNKRKWGRQISNPDSSYQKRKAKAIQATMKEGGHDEKTAEKIVLAKWSKERSLAYILKPNTGNKKDASIPLNAEPKVFAKNKADVSIYQKRLGRNIRYGLNKEHAIQDATYYMIDRHQRARIAQKKYRDKKRLEEERQKDDKSAQ